MDGSPRTLYDDRPCPICQGRVATLAFQCVDCKRKVLRPQDGPQTAFLSCDADIVLYGGGAGGGKAVRIDESVPTPDGWTTMGALQSGDVIFDEHGQSTVVALAHPVELPPAMRVTFDDGIAIDASTEHLWLARGEVIPTKALRVGDPMPVAPAVEGPCRIEVPAKQVRRVARVEPIGPVPMRCITVANPSGLFLVGKHHLVTHNSIALLLDAGCYAGIPGWNGIVLRRHHKDLTKVGGLFLKAKKMFTDPEGHVRIRHSPLDIRWPSEATLEFAHLGPENYLDYQGLELAWIGIDEATHCDIEHIKYLITRMRTDTGLKALLRLTCNPDPDHPLREWVEWYLLPDGTADRSKSGTVRYLAIRSDSNEIVWGDTPEEAAAAADRPVEETLSFAFIASLFDDNKALLASDPRYTTKLAMKGHVEEERLRRGNWNVREETGGMIRRDRWGGDTGLLRRPLAPIVKWVRAWDKAATKPAAGKDPDFTAGVLMGLDLHGRVYVAGLAACREEPPEVAELQRLTALADGERIIQCAKISGGDTGKSDFLNTRKVLRVGGGQVVSLREITNKVVRLQPLADVLYMGMIGNKPALSYHREPGEMWEPRGWILNPDAESAEELGIPHCANWFDQPYHDAGRTPKTLGRLFWAQVDPFQNPKAHDDIPDAMGDAFTILSRAPSVDRTKQELDRWRRMVDG